MTKIKNKYNNKARLNSKNPSANANGGELKSILQIDTLKEQIQLENDTNMLILPANKKHKEKLKEKHVEPAKKKLSKKQRKNYERILEKKDKNSKRGQLLENLSKLQVKQDELNLYSSVRDIGKREKRKLFEVEPMIVEEEPSGNQENENDRKINTISGCNKKKHNVEMKDESTDNTDDYSTDDEINNEELDSALKAARENQKKETLAKSIAKIELERKLAEEKEREEERKANLIGLDRKSRYIHVERSNEIKEMRSKLPIITEEQLVMEKIFENQIVIICGETGSGKTTQTPQFLYEAGFAQDNLLIGVTEPRRVAAISMSKRVAYEMNLSEEIVSYQIRYEANVSTKTKIKFMTDGVLLKEIQHVSIKRWHGNVCFLDCLKNFGFFLKDFLLSRYSVIIIDEAHERSVYTDILIGLLSRIVPLRHKVNILILFLKDF
jgi:ATP-dependent RNA helicase DHX37/DHR1